MKGLRLVGFRRASELRFIEKVILGEIATGVSSEALTRYVLFDKPLHSNRPYDRGDFSRCVEVYNAASKRLRKKMNPIMLQWAAQLREEAGNDPSHYKYVSWPRP